ncbi:MAG: hypothetical protein GXP45_06270 [bacterium]|nr:hypothetical protein [bacterium]
MTARENLKFIFMILFRELGKKISTLLSKHDITYEVGRYVTFPMLIDFLEGNTSKNILDREILNNKEKEKIASMIILPSVINIRNTLTIVKDQIE